MSREVKVSAVPEAGVSARGFALPLFIHAGNRVWVGGLMFLAAALLYLGSNHLFLFPPRQLPMTWLDLSMPFWPNTVWVYNSEYVYFAVIYASNRSLQNLNRYFYSFITLQTVSCLIFWAWPTIYPRENYPLPTDLNAATYHLFHLLRQADTAANCCPSLHVSLVYLSAFVFLRERPRGRFYFFLAWGTLITLSTLTTKQHYLVDVISGFLMAVLFHGIFYRLARYRNA